MTNYNDGNWHGWNGGECPVHPKTVVEVVGGQDSAWRTTASEENVAWCNVAAFRVIKEHKEPSEYWVDPERCISVPSYHAGFIHVREVLDND